MSANPAHAVRTRRQLYIFRCLCALAGGLVTGVLVLTIGPTTQRPVDAVTSGNATTLASASIVEKPGPPEAALLAATNSAPQRVPGAPRSPRSLAVHVAGRHSGSVDGADLHPAIRPSKSYTSARAAEASRQASEEANRAAAQARAEEIQREIASLQSKIESDEDDARRDNESADQAEAYESQQQKSISNGGGGLAGSVSGMIGVVGANHFANEARDRRKEAQEAEASASAARDRVASLEAEAQAATAGSPSTYHGGVQQNGTGGFETIDAAGTQVRYNGPYADEVRRVLAAVRSSWRTPSCPTCDDGKPPQPPAELPCMRDHYMWAAAVNAYGAESYARRGQQQLAVQYATNSHEEMESVEHLRSNAPAMAGGPECVTFSWWP